MITKTSKTFKIENQGLCFIPKEFLQECDMLAPGTYRITVEQIPTEVIKAKSAYFSRESELAKYLGYSKPELHEALKQHSTFGKRIGTDGKCIYESVADMVLIDDVVSRIRELEIFAVEEFQYTFKPYGEETSHGKSLESFIRNLKTGDV